MYSFASICTAGGVYEHGLKVHRIKPEWAVEINPRVAEVYKLNYPDSKIIVADACEVDWVNLPRTDFLHASPSCRSFSQLNNKVEAAKDIAVAQAVARAIAHFKPDIFTLENVTKYQDSESWTVIKSQLEYLGYKFSTQVVRMRFWGVPQKQRNRFIVIATLNQPKITLIRPNRTNYWYECIEDLIPNLKPSELTNTQIKYLTDKTKRAIANGETVLLKRNQIRSTTGCAYQSEPYCWTPTATLCTDQDEKERSKFADLVTSEGIFKLNVRCLARIQTIPDSYKLPESIAIAGLVVGNAIPPLFAAQMWEQILNQVTSSKEQVASKELIAKSQKPKAIKAKPITFAHTSDQLLSGNKTCTRRNWKEVTVKTFTKYYEEGRLIPAYDRSPRNKGNKIALIKLTAAPYLEKLADMPEEDLGKEGGMCATVDDFISTYFKGDRSLYVWVIRFEVVEFLAEPRARQLTLDLVADKLFPSRNKEKLLAGKQNVCRCAKTSGELILKRWDTRGKQYSKYYFYCSEKKVYIPSKRVEQVSTAIKKGKSDSEILEIIESAELLNHTNTIPASKNRRLKGEGTGCILKKPIKRGNKTYDQYWFKYEIWSNGKCQERSKYIPKSREGVIAKLNADKEPVAEILKAIGAKNDGQI